MSTQLSSSATPFGAKKPNINYGAAVTRSLLGYGVIVGPIYLLAGVVQGLVRDGFDFGRHPLSVLSNGPGGWVQTTNFALCGLMVIAAAVGFARMPAPRLRAASWFLGAYGGFVLSAAIFRADAMDGFPAGTPLGPPTSISTMGMLHFVVGTLGFVCLAISAFCAARPMSKRNEPMLARLSVLTGLGVLIGFFGGFFIPGLAGGTVGIWIAVVLGWAWLSVLSIRLYRLAPSVNCEPVVDVREAA